MVHFSIEPLLLSLSISLFPFKTCYIFHFPCKGPCAPIWVTPQSVVTERNSPHTAMQWMQLRHFFQRGSCMSHFPCMAHLPKHSAIGMSSVPHHGSRCPPCMPLQHVRRWSYHTSIYIGDIWGGGGAMQWNNNYVCVCCRHECGHFPLYCVARYCVLMGYFLLCS